MMLKAGLIIQETAGVDTPWGDDNEQTGKEEVRSISNTEGKEAQVWIIGETGENDDKRSE